MSQTNTAGKLPFNMKVAFVLALAVAAILAVDQKPIVPVTRQQWVEFKATHGKAYLNAVDDTKRFRIYQQNLAEIEAHNQKYVKGEVTYKKAINQFGDMTKEEFLAYVNRGKASKPKVSSKLSKPFVPSNTPLPDQVDWRQQGAVTEVKDQGQCGSSWSFSATGALEGQLAINGSGLINLSEQNLIDCSTNYANFGCKSGLADRAFDYIHDNGIESESDYPYEAKDGDCRFDASKSVTRLSGFYEIPFGSESALQEAVAQGGPVSAVIDATDALQFYNGGYFYDSNCNSIAWNHSVLVVGYGSMEEGDYWIVKNCWGESWGEGGYFNLARNAENMCGIATAASLPQL